MRTSYHSAFTPESDRETLESLFVARQDLAESVMAGIRDSAMSGNLHQRLLVGPRGIGKTHFIALIYHRVYDDPELREKLRIAWLQEDLYVASYADLLLEILQALVRKYEQADLKLRLQGILDLGDPRTAEVALEKLLRDALGDKTLLLLSENFDDLLIILKTEGQRKLRAFIQNYRSITILATTTSLIDAVTERDETFYGFFRISVLEPFNVEQAAQLLTRLAQLAGKTDLAEAINSPMGRARLQAVHYLAGGNPRIYVVFYDFLSRESLDELTRPFMKLLDDLTPYYQARMSSLAPLQRRIIDVLRRLKGAATVSDIARQIMNSSPTTVSSQIGKLVDLGYIIQVASIGRSNYYEMREPLMHLCLDVKEHRGRVIEMFVQFLRVWYSATELENLADVASAPQERAYVSEAIRRAKSEPDPVLPAVSNDFFIHQFEGRYDQALISTEVAIQRAPDDKVHWIHKARCLARLERSIEEQLETLDRVIELDPEDSTAWNKKSVLFGESGRYDEAWRASQRAVELQPEEPTFLRNHSFYLAQVGHVDEARQYREKAMSLSEPKTASDWDWRGVDLWNLDRKDEALTAYCKALELDPHQSNIWGHLLSILREQGRVFAGHRAASLLIELWPQQACFHSNLGTSLSDMGRYEEALASYDNSLKLDPDAQDASSTTFFRALMLSYLGRDREALEALERSKLPKSEKMQFRCKLTKANIQMWLGYLEKGQIELDRVLEQDQPSLWTGEELRNFFLATFIKNPNPAAWRSFIKTWLTVFGKHRRLHELGQGLVRTLRALIIPWISDQTAQAWYQTWKELAGDLDEMDIPLRLLEAGVEYRITRDQRVLLSLAREERGLLEPWLINQFREEPDEIDHDIKALLRSVEQRLAEEAEAEKRRAFWRSAPPQLESLDFEHLLERYGHKPPSLTPNPLLPGSWHDLSRDEAELILRLVAQQSETGARAWSLLDLSVFGIERRSLAFSNWFLYQVAIEEDGLVGAIDLMASENEVVILDGLAATIFALVQNKTISLDSPEARSEYTRFFNCALRAEGARFQIVDSPADVRLLEDTELPENASLRAWELVEQSADSSSEEHSAPVYSATVFYSKALFYAEFRLVSFENGLIDMFGDEPLVDDLPCASERFDGPIRFLEPARPGRG